MQRSQALNASCTLLLSLKDAETLLTAVAGRDLLVACTTQRIGILEHVLTRVAAHTNSTFFAYKEIVARRRGGDEILAQTRGMHAHITHGTDELIAKVAYIVAQLAAQTVRTANRAQLDVAAAASVNAMPMAATSTGTTVQQRRLRIYAVPQTHEA